jgi:hypothetical protein
VHTSNEHQTPTQVGVFLMIFENEGVSEVATLPVSKTGPGGSSPPTLAKAAKLMRMSRRLISAR